MWWARYIGLPFKDGGRDANDGLDCWGLVRFVFLREFGRELPSYGEIGANDLIAVARAIEAGQRSGPADPIDIGMERPFDIAFMASTVPTSTGVSRGLYHAGIVTRPGHILHTEEAFDAVEMCFRDMPGVAAHAVLRNRVRSIHRLRAA